MTLLDYLLRANLYLFLLYGCYYLLLRRHTFFGLNRAYLLVSAGLSLILPLVELPTETVAALPATPVQLPTLTLVQAEATSSGPDWALLGWGAYGLIALGLLIRLIWRTTRLLGYIRQQPQQPLHGFTLVHPADPQTPTFSFFGYMILSPADRQAEAVRTHELVHIRQWHSVDVLFFEFLQALFWYNPVLLAYRASIRQVHEFLADAGASATHRADYARYLVTYALGDGPEVLANSFFKPSLLVPRLRMLQRRATNRWALGKYALVLPVTLVTLALTAARPEVEHLIVEPFQTQKPAPIKGRVVGPDNKPLPGANVIVRNATHGTTTDRSGQFTLDVKPGTRLVVSFAGFATQEVVAQAGRELLIRLAPQSGRSASQKSALAPGKKQPVSRQTTDQISTQGQAEDIIAVQEHMVVGQRRMAVGDTNNRPVQIRIRGNSAGLGTPPPLFIVDGVDQKSEVGLSELNPKDIESINVLKGSSAYAIYGEKGTHGVVIVTTKTGKKHETKPAEPGKH
ncbi:TonB-dependent receptor plug domain-containing protein [Rudanella paleaurantiibacter]|uniref:TonB-dependent receptor plug domain-containing protein n=1 Tax=Rudanella paleaurantiibacter TaxID=2614655 RepID=A0A7J5U2F0_9BACT|nr:carboxypeptidase-like regulatory domain-containing protein [Rudanella paleaurantiibacter]KAB7731964.1 TonB-dependent receptor plug domain-containing protein [Rudanella paleaurantiibacter]